MTQITNDVQAVQWAPSGNLMDGIPGQILRLLSVDGKTFGYAGGDGWSMGFGTASGQDIYVNPGQWVIRASDGTITVSDEPPTA